MKTVANLFATTHTALGIDQQQDRHFVSIERFPPNEDHLCTFVKRVEGLAQNEYWVAREKNILMLLKKTPYVVRLRKEEDKNESSYQTVKTLDAGISLAYWLRTKPLAQDGTQALRHPFGMAGCFLTLAKHCVLALKHIHQMGVIHANLRLDNICVPYTPYPYEFNGGIKLDYENLALIDFMFAISNALKLSRPLPILTTAAQSAQLVRALEEDKENRNADRIQRIDYSVDMYALGVILEQISQYGLVYPTQCHAELSMEIHNFIAELKSYKHGIPEAIKVKYFHLLPHDAYLKQLDYLLSLDPKAVNTEPQLLSFDPAQFLEDDMAFSSQYERLEPENLSMTVESPSSHPPISTASSSTTTESTAMKDYLVHAPTADDADVIHLKPAVIIPLILTAMMLFFVYREGHHLNLDILSSMGLILIIGGFAAFAGKIFSPPPPPRLRPVIIEPNIVPNTDNSPTTATASVSLDDIDSIAAEAGVSAHVAPTTPAAASVSLSKAAAAALTTEDDEDAPPISANAETIELNKWAVIALVIASMTALFTWHLIGLDNTPASTTAAPSDNASTEPVASEVAPEVTTTDSMSSEVPADVVPTDIPLDATTPEPATTTPSTASTRPSANTAAAAANIALLSEVSSVKAPEASAPKAKKDTTDSFLLSDNSSVATAPAKPAKEKPVKAPKTTAAQATPAPTVAKEDVAPPITDTTTTTTSTDSTPAADSKAKSIAKESVVADKAPGITATGATASAPTAAPAKPAVKSITRGLAESQNNMGWHYYHGDGVPKDYEEAAKWFQKAANLGEPSAQFNLGMMYAAGTGVKQDLGEAAKWYRKSAEQNKTSAQLNLGMMYISGRGVRQNIDEGVKWLNKAADQGDTTAKANLDWLVKQGYVKGGDLKVEAPAEAAKPE